MLFSIEEPSLANFLISEIINEFRTINNLDSSEKIYVFIDEIQFRAGWEREIRSLYDSENIKFVLTGSSTMLLSENLAFLTGRYLKTTVYPLSFKEFLKFKKIKVKPVDSFLLNRHVINFFQIGGMPEFVLNQPDRYLETTIESILFKDLVSKFRVRNPQILGDLIYLLSDRVGSTSSSLKLSNIIEINKDSISTYLSYLEQTFIICQLNNFSTSRNKQIYNPPKIYFTDTGTANTYASKTNFGALAENAIFNHLKKKTANQLHTQLGYWYEDKQEIDFVIKKKNQLTLIESKWVDKVEEINFKPLQKVLHNLSPKRIIYVTKTLRGKVEIEKQPVELIPLAEFLLK